MKLGAFIAERANDGPSQSPKSSPAIRPEERTATTLVVVRSFMAIFRSGIIRFCHGLILRSNETKMSCRERERAWWQNKYPRLGKASYNDGSRSAPLPG